jgi:hypothetical protein
MSGAYSHAEPRTANHLMDIPNWKNEVCAMNEKFQTVVDVEVDYNSEKPEGFDYEFCRAKTNINYDVSIECRAWGIKNIVFMMLDQEISCNLELVKSDEEDPEEFPFKIKLKEMEIETDNVNLASGDIYPSSVSIQLSNIRKEDGSFVADGTGVLVF